MKISLLTVPVEVDYSKFAPHVEPGIDVFVPSIRSQGQLPVMPKIAIVSLIQWMERHGYGSDQWDYYDVDMLMPTDPELRDYFKTYKPDVVGLSAVVSTCYSQVQRLARLIRDVCPETLIVLGGSLTASANLMLRKTDVDICVVGDGEIAWVGLLDYAKEHGRRRDDAILSKIKGLAWIGADDELQFTGYGPPVPGEKLPFPDYEILKAGLKNKPEELVNYFRTGLGSTAYQTDPRSWEKHRRPMLAGLWSSKGCVARCTFCQRSTKGYRVSSAETLDEHLQHLAEKHDVGFIWIIDENFGSDRTYAYELARTMKKREMMWMAAGVRVSSMTREDIFFFKEHGCVSLKFGIESGSQKILDLMEKKFTSDRVYTTLKHCADAQVYSPLAVMVGMPGETNETVMETGRFVGRISHMQGIDPRDGGLGFFYAQPFPGTPLYVYAQQRGLIGKTPDEEEKYLLSVSGSGAGKMNYINLTSEPLRDVIWWDWLVRLEAERAFLELLDKEPLPPPNYLQKTLIDDTKKEIIGKAMTLREAISRIAKGSLYGIRSKLFYGIDYFMEHTVVRSHRVARLPRWLIYPPLHALVYFEHLMQKTVTRALDMHFNIFDPRPKVAPPEATDHMSARMSWSLRTVVREQARAIPPRSSGEAAQDVLYIGL